MRPVLGVHWKDWCWSWNSSTSATRCEELTHWKRPWCWEWLKAGGEGGDREWDGWMLSLTQWKWVWASSRSWWWTGKPGVLQSMGSQRVRYYWATELNNKWCWASFHVFISLCMFSLEKCLFRSSAHFWLGCLSFWYWATWSACVLWSLTLCHLFHPSYFLPFWGLPSLAKLLSYLSFFRFPILNAV